MYALLEDHAGGKSLDRQCWRRADAPEKWGLLRPSMTKEGLSNDVVLSLHEDRSGALWIGTDGGGLNRLRNGRFTVYTTKEGLADDAVYAITEDGKGNLWAGTHWRFEPIDRQRTAFANYGVGGGLRNDYVRSTVPRPGWRPLDWH